MEKNTVWAVVLSGLVLIIFMFIQTTFFPAAQNAVPDMSSTQAAAADGTIPVINEAASVSSFTVERSEERL